MNGYFQSKLTTIFHLGLTADEKLYAVSTHTIVLSNKLSVVFHDGLTDKHPVLATAHGDRWGRNRPIILTLPTRPGSQHNDTIVEEMVPGSLKETSHTFTFTALVGPTGTTREAFEWRQSQGNEIKGLAGHSFGWKLVRLTGPMNTAGEAERSVIGVIPVMA
jgi:hypothetical protein